MSQIVRRCILINGTMGAGKTTVCKELMRLLPHSAFLDGDWCWYSDPFTVNDRTKEMVLQNIGFVLSNFLRCPDYQNILFCWVMDRQEILDEVIRRIRPALDDAQAQLFCVTLSVTSQALRRAQRDIDAGLLPAGILWSAALRGCRCTGSCPPGRWMSPTFLPSRRRRADSSLVGIALHLYPVLREKLHPNVQLFLEEYKMRKIKRPISRFVSDRKSVFFCGDKMEAQRICFLLTSAAGGKRPARER